MSITMTSFKPYLARAVYDWICDNNCTPYILVNAEYPGVQVPRQYVKKGVIVLNISPFAVNRFLFNNEELEFEARFSGAARKIYVPIPAIQAIYAQENGAGKVFSEEEFPAPAASLMEVAQGPSQAEQGAATVSASTNEKAKAGPQLKIVKKNPDPESES